MSQQGLDPAGAEEGELAATARTRLMAALDHSEAAPLSRHHHIEPEELTQYQEARKQRSEDALKTLRKVSDEIGEEL